MKTDNLKCVLLIDESLPVGIIANTAAIMGITLGKAAPDIVGRDVTDEDGNHHSGIIEIPVPILKGTPELIKTLRQTLYEEKYSDVTTVDFSDLAQGCKTYDEFINKMIASSERGLRYLGIGICGPKKKINRLTGNLPLLR